MTGKNRAYNTGNGKLRTIHEERRKQWDSGTNCWDATSLNLNRNLNMATTTRANRLNSPVSQ